MNRFITRGTIKAVLSGAAWIAALLGHSWFGDLVTRPEVIEAILALLGLVLGMSAGADEGIKPPTPSKSPTGYHWDSFKGWVKDA
jgi:hypothetical protein